jgi:hypothetical protein
LTSIVAVERHYWPVLVGATRLHGGDRLWRQFEDVVRSYRSSGNVLPVVEKVNELAVAGILLDDPSLADRPIHYEPEITADGRRIDFVVSEVEAGNLYVEVKTVHPRTQDTDENWNKVESRQKHHQAGVHYIVQKEWMGATLYGNSFAARGKFLDYTREFEPRLAGANEIAPGRGVLVFCGNGFAWDLSELEDFADFYHTGRHRSDDPFAKMEAHSLTEERIELRRNIASLGYVKRGHPDVAAEKWVASVRGPSLFRG